MRKKLIAGNWKMNTDRPAAIKLARGVVGRAGMHAHVDLLVCPPFVNLFPVSEIVKDTLAARRFRLLAPLAVALTVAALILALGIIGN